jgi:hypothetical protein
MNAYIIQSGHFSKAGNFMGISVKGERIHIYKKDIIRLFPQVGIVYRCLGQYEKELVKLPFYCLAEEKTFDQIDFDGNKTGEKFTRLTAIEIREHEYEIKTVLVNSRIVSLEMDLHCCKQDYDKLQEEYDALVAKVEDYNANAELNECRMVIDHLTNQIEDLEEENDKLTRELQTANWNYEYAQSERERLELLCKEHEYTIIELLKDNDELEKYKKTFETVLTSYHINQLINNV